MKYVTWLLAVIVTAGSVYLLVRFPTQLVALGTIAVAVLAVWGDWFRSRLAGPKLEVCLRDPLGRTEQGLDCRCYYLVVRNKRRRSPARNVRVVCSAIYRGSAEGTLEKQPLLRSVQFKWLQSGWHDPVEPVINPTIGEERTCIFVSAYKTAKRLVLETYETPDPPSLRFAEAGRTLRLEIAIFADNFELPRPHVLDISWDGIWADDSNGMSKRLVIKGVQRLDSQR